MHDFSTGSTAEDIDRRLWLELTPEQYALVRELVRLESETPIDGLLAETDRLVEALAAHFPGLAPAIRAVAQHVIDRGAIYEDGPLEACCGGDAATTAPGSETAAALTPEAAAVLRAATGAPSVEPHG